MYSSAGGAQVGDAPGRLHLLRASDLHHDDGLRDRRRPGGPQQMGAGDGPASGFPARGRGTHALQRRLKPQLGGQPQEPVVHGPWFRGRDGSLPGGERGGGDPRAAAPFHRPQAGRVAQRPGRDRLLQSVPAHQTAPGRDLPLRTVWHGL